MNQFQKERRFWLKKAALISATGAASTLSGLTAMNALAQGDDYRALVCVFLHGGNDSFNMFVPRTEQQFNLYAQARRNLTVSRSQLHSVSPTASDGSQYGFHPAVPEMANLFNRGKLAVVANVGPLIVPTTREQFQRNSVPLPPRLFSHNDQQDFWYSLQSGASKQTGWAGRIADAMQSSYSSGDVSMNVSMAGSNLMQIGRSTIPFSLASSGVVQPKMETMLTGYGKLQRRQQAMNSLLNQDSGHLLGNHYRDSLQHALSISGELGQLLGGVGGVGASFPDTDLGATLNMVAKLIAVRSQLGLRRQIFFVGCGGWDTHGAQATRHPVVLSQMSQALGAFYQATESLGVAEQVTTFTAADFGRSLTTNGDGTDHGWGGHQMVLGGAVKGNAIFGKMPEIRIEGPDDAGRGRIIPSTSVDQYAATLAQWYGLPTGNVGDVFPNLGNFNEKNLAFL